MDKVGEARTIVGCKTIPKAFPGLELVYTLRTRFGFIEGRSFESTFELEEVPLSIVKNGNRNLIAVVELE